jgi:hypothetical protein
MSTGTRGSGCWGAKPSLRPALLAAKAADRARRGPGVVGQHKHHGGKIQVVFVRIGTRGRALGRTVPQTDAC